jgi:uncharacterized NAD(P)/FAD-binding protein YdhS
MTYDRPVICVIGGGFTGAAAAIACLKRLAQPFRLSVVEPGAALGRGVAFGGHHPLHLLNVRARDLSIHAGQPGDFLNWAFRQLDQGENDAGLHQGLAHTFLPRQLFGEYVRQRLFEAVSKRKDVAFDVIGAMATACSFDGRCFRLRFGRAEPLKADIVILATAYGAQGLSATGALAPFDGVAPERFANARSMALIGSGLTMVDVLFSARRDGFSGTATVISRRGQLSRVHAPKGVVPQQVGLPQSKRMSRLSNAVRIACEAAEAHGTPWQAIINGLRPSLQDMWRGLAVEEQSRFLRHVRPFWDAHRHRLPAEVHERLQSEFAKGSAVLLRGRVMGVERGPNSFALTLKRRGSDRVETMRTDVAFDCSGHKPDLGSPLIRGLIGQGLARADAHSLGLAVKPNGHVVGTDDLLTPGLFALGPLGQGTLWEITAVPEIVRQADAAAASIAALREQVEGAHPSIRFHY